MSLVINENQGITVRVIEPPFNPFTDISWDLALNPGSATSSAWPQVVGSQTAQVLGGTLTTQDGLVVVDYDARVFYTGTGAGTVAEIFIHCKFSDLDLSNNELYVLSQLTPSLNTSPIIYVLNGDLWVGFGSDVPLEVMEVEVDTDYYIYLKVDGANSKVQVNNGAVQGVVLNGYEATLNQQIALGYLFDCDYGDVFIKRGSFLTSDHISKMWDYFGL